MRALALALLPMLAFGLPQASAAGATAAARDAVRQDSVIRVRAGEEFSVTLQSNPSTGYRWMLADSLEPETVQLLSRTYVGSRPVMPGSGGAERFTFRAVAPGQTTLWLRYARDPEARAPRTAAFRVIVRPAAQ